MDTQPIEGDRAAPVGAVAPAPTAGDAGAGDPFGRTLGRTLPRSGLANELRTPLEAVTRALHRLSLHRAGTDGTPSTLAPLIRRGRGLAHELQVVVEEILQAATPDVGAAQRSKQETVSGRAILENARDALGDLVVPERIEITSPEGFTVTTHPDRLHQVLVEVITLADRVGSRAPLRLDARRNDGSAEFDVQWVERTVRQPGTLDYGAETAVARALLRSLAGSIAFFEDRLAGGRTLVTARLVLPQQRALDGVRAR